GWASQLLTSQDRVPRTSRRHPRAGEDFRRLGGRVVAYAPGRQRIIVASRWTLHGDAGVEPATILEMNSDITAKKEAELSLARAQEQLTQELSGTRGLHELASRLIMIEDLPSLLQEVLATALQITGADRGNIQLLHANGTLHIEAQHGFLQDFLEFFRSVE